MCRRFDFWSYNPVGGTELLYIYVCQLQNAKKIIDRPLQTVRKLERLVLPTRSGLQKPSEHQTVQRLEYIDTLYMTLGNA